MQKLDQQQLRDEQELAAMQEDLGRIGAAAAMATGHQSEPTTPPEYRETTSSGFPSMFSRPNRYSTSSLTSPPGLLFNRPGRSGSQIASPQSGINMQSSASAASSSSAAANAQQQQQQQQQHFGFDDQLPSRSVPTTRRNSDEDEKEEAVRQDPTSHRSTNAYVQTHRVPFSFALPFSISPCLYLFKRTPLILSPAFYCGLQCAKCKTNQ